MQDRSEYKCYLKQHRRLYPETPIPKPIGKHCCHKTQKKHLTQAQLSEQTGIHRTMIGRIERGDYMPTIPQLKKL